MLRKTPKARLARLAAPLARDWRAVLQEFLLHKRAEGRAPRTIRDYRIRLGRFFEAHPEAFGDFEAFRRAVREHLAALDTKAPATYNLPLEYLRALCRWCVAEGYLPGGPTAGLSKRKDPGQARAVPEGVLQALLEACDRRTFCGPRDYALILFRLDTGVRPGEALRLMPAYFNLAGNERDALIHGHPAATAQRDSLAPHGVSVCPPLLSMVIPAYDFKMFAVDRLPLGWIQ